MESVYTRRRTVMSRDGLRSLAKRLASDSDLKKRLLSDGEGVLSKFDLSAGEREAVLRTRQRLALATSAGQVEASTAEPLSLWL